MKLPRPPAALCCQNGRTGPYLYWCLPPKIDLTGLADGAPFACRMFHNQVCRFYWSNEDFDAYANFKRLTWSDKEHSTDATLKRLSKTNGWVQRISQNKGGESNKTAQTENEELLSQAQKDQKFLTKRACIDLQENLEKMLSADNHGKPIRIYSNLTWPSWQHSTLARYHVPWSEDFWHHADFWNNASVQYVITSMLDSMKLVTESVHGVGAQDTATGSIEPTFMDMSMDMNDSFVHGQDNSMHDLFSEGKDPADMSIEEEEQFLMQTLQQQQQQMQQQQQQMQKQQMRLDEIKRRRSVEGQVLQISQKLTTLEADNETLMAREGELAQEQQRKFHEQETQLTEQETQLAALEEKLAKGLNDLIENAKGVLKDMEQTKLDFVTANFDMSKMTSTRSELRDAMAIKSQEIVAHQQERSRLSAEVNLNSQDLAARLQKVAEMPAKESDMAPETDGLTENDPTADDGIADSKKAKTSLETDIRVNTDPKTASTSSDTDIGTSKGRGGTMSLNEMMQGAKVLIGEKDKIKETLVTANLDMSKMTRTRNELRDANGDGKHPIERSETEDSDTETEQRVTRARGSDAHRGRGRPAKRRGTRSLHDTDDSRAKKVAHRGNRGGDRNGGRRDDAGSSKDTADASELDHKTKAKELLGESEYNSWLNMKGQMKSYLKDHQDKIANGTHFVADEHEGPFSRVCNCLASLDHNAITLGVAECCSSGRISNTRRVTLDVAPNKSRSSSSTPSAALSPASVGRPWDGESPTVESKDMRPGRLAVAFYENGNLQRPQSSPTLSPQRIAAAAATSSSAGGHGSFSNPAVSAFHPPQAVDLAASPMFAYRQLVWDHTGKTEHAAKKEAMM